MRSQMEVKGASGNNLTWTRTEGRKEHKRIGEPGSYVYLFIADSAVPVKVTAHLAADIPPAGSYTLPSH